MWLKPGPCNCEVVEIVDLIEETALGVRAFLPAHLLTSRTRHQPQFFAASPLRERFRPASRISAVEKPAVGANGPTAAGRTDFLKRSFAVRAADGHGSTIHFQASNWSAARTR
jgi:hypothetical protein